MQAMCQPDMIEEPLFSAKQMQNLRREKHSHCVVCKSDNPAGLNLDFTLIENGAVQAEFMPNSYIQGYNGLVQGGVIASLLDGAMTNCLFAHGKEALTAELVVRYRKPVLVGERIFLRAWIEQSSSLLFCMRSELAQNGCVKAVGKAKFLNRP